MLYEHFDILNIYFSLMLPWCLALTLLGRNMKNDIVLKNTHFALQCIAVYGICKGNLRPNKSKFLLMAWIICKETRGRTPENTVGQSSAVCSGGHNYAIPSRFRKEKGMQNYFLLCGLCVILCCIITTS